MSERAKPFLSGIESMAKLYSSLLLGGRKRIVLTGHFPFDQNDLQEVLAAFHDTTTGQDFDDEVADFVIIGRNDFDEVLIRSIVKRWGNDPIYLPQEALIDQLLFGWDWHENPEWLLDLAESHPGLQFLQSCQGFAWPGTEAEESSGSHEGQDVQFEDETDLHRLGYVVGKNGLSDYERWQLLCNKAVPEYGLQTIAYTIASNIKRFKRQRNGRVKYEKSIRDWESDLERLRKEYYTGNFRWPSIEP